MTEVSSLQEAITMTEEYLLKGSKVEITPIENGYFRLTFTKGFLGKSKLL